MSRLPRNHKPARVATLAAAIAITAGCAASPEDIAAIHVDEGRYQDLTCQQANAERERIDASLDTASERQRETRSKDTAGVIFLGLPVSSMSGSDLEPEIARLKGERDAIERIIDRKSCAGTVAASATGSADVRAKSSTVAPSEEYLSAAALRRLFAGARMKGTRPTTGAPYTMRLRSNGTLSGETARGLRPIYFDGTWSVKDPNQWCFKLPTINGCRWVKRIGGSSYQFTDAETGEVRGTATITR